MLRHVIRGLLREDWYHGGRDDDPFETRYLYLTQDKEEAKHYANEKGGQVYRLKPEHLGLAPNGMLSQDVLRQHDFDSIFEPIVEAKERPPERFHDSYLQARTTPPDILFHFTRNPATAIEIVESGHIRGKNRMRSISLTENPAMSGPTGPVFILDTQCILNLPGVELRPHYQPGYQGEAEWRPHIGEKRVSKPVKIPMSCVKEIGYMRRHLQKTKYGYATYLEDIKRLVVAARKIGIRVKLFEWEDWWS